MEGLFYFHPNTFNQDIGGWDVSNVTNMKHMFRQAYVFNQDISRWQTGSVTNMERMFTFSYEFNQDISDWNVSNVTNLFATFESARALNQDFTGWDVSNVTTFQGMFMNATAMLARGAPSTPNLSFFSDASAPTIASTSINTANTELTITFSESVYDTTGGTGDLEVADFALSISGGVATLGSATPTSITKTSQSVWVLGFSTTGTANGSETITVVPASSTSIYDAAANAAATSQSNNTVTLGERVAPTVTLTGPSGVVTAAFAATATFSEAVTGFALDDITVTNGTASSLVTGNAPVYTFTVTPTLGTTVSIGIAANKVTDTAGNANTASNTLSIQAGSPASEFAAKEDAIRSVITDDAQRSLNNTLASNTRLTRKARGRFLTSRTQMQSDGAGLASRNNIALDVDGIAVATPEQMSTQGVFFAQTGNFEGTKRRLVFGDFDIQRDGDTGSTTATINGKIAWEQMLSEQTMLGYYLGVEVGQSNIRGGFTGTQRKYGVSVGGYFVHALQENLFLDGFASLGAGRNNLEMADDTLALTSEYTTQTVTLGAAVSGVIEQNGYDILPELSIAYGKTTIGRVGFTGVAYGLTDDTLSLDAGSVSTATIMFRPEFRVSLDGQKPSESLSTFSFAPRVMCERVQVASTTNNCGFGAELGFTSSTQDGLTSVTAAIVADRIGNSTRSSLQLNLEHKF